MRYCPFLWLLFVFNYSYSQTINGEVLDENGAVTFANVLIKRPQQPNVIYQFGKTNDKGQYSINLREILDTIIVEVTTYEHEPVQKKVYNVRGEQNITLNFRLEPRITSLKEVVITDDKPIKVKKDTIIYDVSKFKNGSEKVIEDLLRNLPGIKIEDNGEIKFKGKSIKKMLLDGDDLFSDQYTIGSKNIDVDLLDKVEAVENYNENALLRGLLSSDDVAINLKLKKGKTNFSGNANLGFGYQNKQSASVSGILINSKTKSFGISSFNNIGVNNTPYDFNSSILSVESMKEKNMMAKEVISQGSFYSALEDKFHRINNNFYTSINSLYKFNSKITGKINLGFYSDKLTRESQQNTYFAANNESFTIHQTENIVKSPELYNANFQFANNVSKTFNWEYLGKLNYQTITYKNLSSNNSLLQENDVSTKNWFTKQNVNFTKRLNDESGITTSVYYSNSNAPQEYVLTPGVNINETETVRIKQSNQESRFDKEIINASTLFLNKFNYFKVAVRTGFYSEKNKYTSFLETINENNESYTNSNFQNSLLYKYNFPYIDAGLTYDKNKIVFKIGLGAQYFDLKVKSNLIENQNNLIFNPSIKFLYRFTKHTNLVSSYSFNQIAPQEINLFEGFVQTSFSSFRNNEANMEFLKTHTYSLNLNYGDSFYLTNMSLGLNYNQRKNNFFYKSTISPDYTITTSFLLNSGNQDYGINFSGEKFINYLKSNFKIYSNYSISLDKNIVNNSELRDIKAKSFLIDLTTNTSISKSMYIENKFSYRANTIMLQGMDSNNFSSLNNAFKAVLKPSDRLKGTMTVNFVIPDLVMNNNYLFLDSEIIFSSKNKKLDYSIIGRNLTNNTVFETTNISDYSKTVSSHNLINRFILASIAFKF